MGGSIDNIRVALKCPVIIFILEPGFTDTEPGNPHRLLCLILNSSEFTIITSLGLIPALPNRCLKVVPAVLGICTKISTITLTVS